MNIAVIGGGAAGFFSAIAAAENYPDAKVILFEKSKKLLAKVRISGGGRCNVTNGCTSIKELSESYPRGGRELKKAFRIFNTKHTMQWFEEKGVALKIEADNRVFPVSNRSETIIDCLLNEAKRLGITIDIGKNVKAIKQQNDQLELCFAEDALLSQLYDKVIVACGGSPKRQGLEWLETLNHKIINPVPSLFTFNMPEESIRELMGVVAGNALVSIQGSKLKSTGPLLITHWGMSGPAILRLSAFGARILSECGYEFKVQVNWVNVVNNELIREALKAIVAEHPKKYLSNIKPYNLPERLWLFFIGESTLPSQKPWGELGKKGLNKLVTLLSNDVYAVRGKTTFKEEFVTCGGVSLESVNFNTMQSRVCENLYFAGEVLDIDGITGGYNFQAAWTTAFIAGRLG